MQAKRHHGNDITFESAVLDPLAAETVEGVDPAALECEGSGGREPEAFAKHRTDSVVHRA
ncbi:MULTISPECIES: hypothetical protein [Luteimonas]|uniref:hypothetical protein n=1 Tax=Luteimonas TaxID=83614 RepID=UPI000F5097EA|nr:MULTISPECIES: hypothetical protein [Luteimonas]